MMCDTITGVPLEPVDVDGVDDSEPECFRCDSKHYLTLIEVEDIHKGEHICDGCLWETSTDDVWCACGKITDSETLERNGGVCEECR